MFCFVCVLFTYLFLFVHFCFFWAKPKCIRPISQTLTQLSKSKTQLFLKPKLHPKPKCTSPSLQPSPNVTCMTDQPRMSPHPSPFAELHPRTPHAPTAWSIKPPPYPLNSAYSPHHTWQVETTIHSHPPSSSPSPPKPVHISQTKHDPCTSPTASDKHNRQASPSQNMKKPSPHPSIHTEQTPY